MTLLKVHSLGFGDAEIFEVIIHGDQNTSKVVGKKISQLDLPSGCKIGAVYRGLDVIMHDDNLVIKSEDRLIIFLHKKQDFPKLAKLFQVGIGFF